MEFFKKPLSAVTQKARKASSKRTAQEAESQSKARDDTDLEHIDPENSLAGINIHQKSTDIESAILPFNESEDLVKTVEPQDEDSITLNLQNVLDDEDETPHDLDSVDEAHHLNFIDNVISDFTEPKFIANLNSDIKNIDVTVAAETPIEADLGDVAATEKSEDIAEYPENHIHDELAQLHADITAGLQVQRRAEKNLEAINRLLEHAEINQNLLNRLEPENRRLKARNRALEEQVKQLSRKAGVDIANATLQQTNLLDQHSLYDGLNTQLAELRKALNEAEKEAQTARKTARNNTLKAELAEKELSAEQRETAHLRQKIKDLSKALEKKQAEYIEARKMTDSLAQDAFDFRAQADGHAMKNRALQAALDEAERKNKTLKNTLTGLYEDVQDYKVRSLRRLAERDAKINALQNPQPNQQKTG